MQDFKVCAAPDCELKDQHFVDCLGCAGFGLGDTAHGRSWVSAAEARKHSGAGTVPTRFWRLVNCPDCGSTIAGRPKAVAA